MHAASPGPARVADPTADPGAPGRTSVPPWAWSFVALVSAAVVVGLGVRHAGETTAGAFDSWAAAVIDAALPGPGPISWLILTAGDPFPAAGIVLLLAGLCAWADGRALALIALAGPGLSGVVATAAKPVSGRMINDNLCYPSGHTAAVAAMGMVVGLLLARRRPTLPELPVVLGCGAAAGVTIALPLVRDDIHYATDTVGGLCAAFAVVPAVICVVELVGHRVGPGLPVAGPAEVGPGAADARPAATGRPGRRVCGADEYPPALLAVAAHGLPDAGRPFPAAPLDPAAWGRVLAGAERNRVTGSLLAAVSEGALPATEDQARQVLARHRSIQLRVMALEHELVSIVRLLEGEGIETRVLKGSALAHLDYPDPALRSFVDMDVLVRPSDIDRAVVTLAAAGYTRTLAEPRPGFDRRFDKGMTLISPTSGAELDLHRTFVLGPWGLRVDLDGLWDDGAGLVVAGHRLRALSRPHRLMHACYHAALGDWPLRLGSLRDIAEILGRLGPQDSSARAVAVSWGAEAVVAAAVADAHRLLGIPARSGLATWAEGYRPSRKEVSWLALHTHADKTFAAQAVATVRELPRWRDRVAYLRALVLPDPRYTSDRHTSAAARFRYAVREVRRGRGAGPGR